MTQILGVNLMMKIFSKQTYGYDSTLDSLSFQVNGRGVSVEGATHVNIWFEEPCVP